MLYKPANSFIKSILNLVTYKLCWPCYFFLYLNPVPLFPTVFGSLIFDLVFLTIYSFHVRWALWSSSTRIKFNLWMVSNPSWNRNNSILLVKTDEDVLHLFDTILVFNKLIFHSLHELLDFNILLLKFAHGQLSLTFVLIDGSLVFLLLFLDILEFSL